MEQIVLAGGCFWGVSAYFKECLGVLEVKSGYANGNIENPTYKEVCSNIATHAEAVLVTYDEKLTSLKILLDHYFRIVNPFTLNKQGNDIGIQYRSGIYYYNQKQHNEIRDYILDLQSRLDKKIVVEVKKLDNFYLAEEYHQDYLEKNPSGYCHIDLNLLKDHEKKKVKQ